MANKCGNLVNLLRAMWSLYGEWSACLFDIKSVTLQNMGEMSFFLIHISLTIHLNIIPTKINKK